MYSPDTKQMIQQEKREVYRKLVESGMSPDKLRSVYKKVFHDTFALYSDCPRTKDFTDDDVALEAHCEAITRMRQAAEEWRSRNKR